MSTIISDTNLSNAAEVQKAAFNFDNIHESIKKKLPHVLLDVIKNYDEDQFKKSAGLYLKQRLEQRTQNENLSTKNSETHDTTNVENDSDVKSRSSSLCSTNTSKNINSKQSHFTRSREIHERKNVINKRDVKSKNLQCSTTNTKCIESLKSSVQQDEKIKENDNNVSEIVLF